MIRWYYSSFVYYSALSYNLLKELSKCDFKKIKMKTQKHSDSWESYFAIRWHNFGLNGQMI